MEKNLSFLLEALSVIVTIEKKWRVNVVQNRQSLIFKKKKNAKKYTVQLFSFSKNSCSKIKFQQQHLIIGSNAVQTKLRMPLNVFFLIYHPTLKILLKLI